MAEKKDKVNSKKKSKKTKEVKVEVNNGKETNKSKKEEDVEVDEQVEVQEQEAEQVVDFETKCNELNDKYLRLTAEFDNFRRRSLKEKMELIKSAGEDILVNILPVMDNFERALKSMEDNGEDEKKAVVEGVELIYNNFKDFLSQRGVKEIEAIGKDFDTDHHEAITKIPAPEEDLKGKVIDVIEKGYLMHEKVIRFAKVVVGE